jgi:hypothetical protein
MNKPIIVFYEPFEIMAKENGKETYLHRYLGQQKLTLKELLDTFDIDYISFYTSNIRDEKCYPIQLSSKDGIHNFLLKYIN